MLLPHSASHEYSDDPMFAVTILTGITAVFKSYPTLGDTALYVALLSLHPEVFPCEWAGGRHLQDCVSVFHPRSHFITSQPSTKTCAIRW